MNTTGQLKQELWKRFGSKETPAEWDGHVYGGGKLSQRYWEYFRAIEFMDLDEDSVVVDIGGGSPVTGVGFFASLLATAVKKVVIIDRNIAPTAIAPSNVEFVRSHANHDELQSLFSSRHDLTHVVSISVFEHIQPPIREGIVRAINDHFGGRSFVATFEFHASHVCFESQLTARTTSALFEPLTNFYLDDMSASPVWCENAFKNSDPPIPLWYPVAVRFHRVHSVNRLHSVHGSENFPMTQIIDCGVLP